MPERVDQTRYPFNIPAFSHGIDTTITSNVTFFVGENGSGKSTLLEAIAENSGFNPQGGSRDHYVAGRHDPSDLASALRLSWALKVTDGFFMRAESFYNFASYLEQAGSSFDRYGGRALHDHRMANRFSRCSRTSSIAESTSSTSPRPRYRRSVN